MIALLLAAATFCAAAPQQGVLLLAHGGGPEWNSEAARIAAALDKQAPTELALGMADAGEIQGALDRLAAKKVKRVVAVPLFISSRSEVLDQTQYVLGLRDKPSETLKRAMASLPPAAMLAMHAAHHGAMPSFDQRAKSAVPVVMTKALDDDPIVAAIALDRAKALSRDPRRETVFLVAHGPVDDKANEAWLATMRRVAESVEKNGRFEGVEVATIRDDSPGPVKQKAIDALRVRVAAASKTGRAVVIPYLIARGGIEDHIVEALQGLDYAWDAQTLAPDARLAQWAAKRAAEAR